MTQKAACRSGLDRASVQVVAQALTRPDAPAERALEMHPTKALSLWAGPVCSLARASSKPKYKLHNVQEAPT